MPLALRRHVQMMPRRFDVSWRKPDANCVLNLAGADQLDYLASIYDRSGKANHGTLASPTWARLPSGLWGLSFDGDDYVDLGNPASLQTTGKVSFSFWLKTPLQTGTHALITKDNVANDRAYLIYVNNTAGGQFWIQFSSNGSATQVVAKGITFVGDNVLHKWDITFDPTIELVWPLATNPMIYKDGVNQALVGGSTSFVAPTIFNSTQNVNIGRLSSGGWLLSNGSSMYLERIQTDILTLAQIVNSFNQERWMFGI